MRKAYVQGGDADSAGPEADGLDDGASAAFSPQRRRLLYIYPDTVGLNTDPRKNPLHYLSKYLEGDYLAVWVVPDDVTAEERARAMAPANGRIRFRWTRRNALPAALGRVWQLLFFIGTGLRLSWRHGRYDVIVVYGPFRTALAGLILKYLTRSRLIVEFPGHPFRNYDLYSGIGARLKRRVAPWWARAVAARADHVRLLFPWQIDELGLALAHKTSVFHNFTIATTAPSDAPAPETGRYILFLGFPFHLKGVDILIRAFLKISMQFPDCRLLLVGHCPDPEPYRALAAGNPRVEIRRPVSHDQAVALIAGCTVLALASRIEGMARVLIEGMGAGKPVVSSAVGGIPHYIKHGENGLLFESEDVDGLAAQLERVLADPAFAAALGQRARAYVRDNLSEEKYALRFREMVERVLADGR
jgi:glycosyltransferase involved in cell wall biosynthesis